MELIAERGKVRLWKIVPSDAPLEDEYEIDALLQNWAAWCRDRERQGRCLSVEGRYLAPAGNVFGDQELGRTVDPLAAEEVNSAMLELPRQHREALTLRYFKALPDFLVCRRLNLRPTTYSRFLRDARLMLRNVLLFRQTVIKLRVAY